MRSEPLNELRRRVLRLPDEDFDELALRVFRLQCCECAVYRQFIGQLHIDPDSIVKVEDIPFMPIEVFKNRKVQTGSWQPEKVFRSSGTSGQVRSTHLIRSLQFYHDLAIRTFESQICRLQDLPIVALLPHYLEQGQSSLVNMVDAFIRHSAHQLSAFFLNDRSSLLEALKTCIASEKPFLFIGVSYALLDLARTHPFPLGNHAMVMETGGMKGRREELSREQLHSALKAGFNVDRIYSEYGMTELLSQAYSRQGGRFKPASPMQILIKEFNDPFQKASIDKPGVIHVVDLANLDSCSFIATADIGQAHPDRSFEVLGRLENSDLRGCNLLYTEITE